MINRYTVLFFCLLLPLSPLFAGGQGETETVDLPLEGRWSYEKDLSEMEDGVYNILLEAEDQAGNRSQAGPYNFYVDSASDLPGVSIRSPREGEMLTAGFSFLGTAVDDDGIEQVELSLDGGPFLPCSGRDFWSMPGTFEQLSDGAHRIAVRAVDSHGTGGPPAERSFFVDTALPRLVSISPQEGRYHRESFRIEGAVGDSSGIQQLMLLGEGESRDRELSLDYQDQENLYRFELEIDLDDYSPGRNRILFRIQDSAGRVSEYPYIFYIDSQEPELLINEPGKADLSRGKLLLSGRVEDESPVEDLRIRAGEKEFFPEIIPGSSHWSLLFPLEELGEQRKLELSVRDLAGNEACSAIRLDRELLQLRPQLYLSGIPGTEGGLYQLALAAEGRDGIEALEYRLDDGPLRQLPLRDTSLLRFAALSAGAHRIEARVVDSRGVYSRSVEHRFRIRTIEEAVRLEAPLSSRYIENTLKLQGTFSGQQLACRLEDPLSGEEGSFQPITVYNGRFQLHLDLSGRPDGFYFIRLKRGEEKQGALVPVIKRTDMPEITLHSPAEEEILNSSFVLSGRVESRFPVERVELSLDGGESYRIIADGRAFRSLVELPREPLLLRATDSYGGVGHLKLPLSYRMENDRPSLSVDYPLERSLIQEDFTARILASDDDGIGTVFYRIDEGPWRELEGAFFSAPSIQIDSLTDGEHRLEAYCRDKNGLESSREAVSFSVSRSSPQISVDRPVEGSVLRGEQLISGSATDANGIRRVWISLDNGVSYRLCRGGGQWSYRVDTSRFPEGLHSLEIKAEDGAGEQTVYSSLFRFDNTAPELKLSRPAAGAVLGDKLKLSASVNDDSGIASLRCMLQGIGEGASVLSVDLPPSQQLEEEIALSSLSPGLYSLILEAKDRAGNLRRLSRTLELNPEVKVREIALYSPIEGMEYSGNLPLFGKVTGRTLPDALLLLVDGESRAQIKLDADGRFSHRLAGKELSPGEHRISLRSNRIEEELSTAERRILFSGTGPWIHITSPRAGDSLGDRDFISGRCSGAPEKIEISYDNGRSFQTLSSGDIDEQEDSSRWRTRIETSYYPDGRLPVLVRASYSEGHSASEALYLYIDKQAPALEIRRPREGERHNQQLKIEGEAGDKQKLSSMRLFIREGDKNSYQLPAFIQGLYLDSRLLGASYGELGLGLTFFDDNVKLQASFGAAPPGRFSGLVASGKLIANIATLPYSYLFGPAWRNVSSSLALGANFSYFSMTEDSYRFSSDGIVLASVLGQWEIIRYDWPDRSFFRSLSFYSEASAWFISSDVEAGLVPLLSFGIRCGLF